MATGPLIAIVGTTASGKSSLALELAERYSGEIIAADSRTVYKRMDIGTAKPSLEEQARVKHHLIDVVTPDKPFTVADFKQQAIEVIADIEARGKLPILVGGTGLYVDSVLYDFQFRPVNAQKRAQLEELSVEELQQRIREQNLTMPSNQQNPRHLVRVLESAGGVSQKNPLRTNTLIVGLQINPETLEKRIIARVDEMFAQSLPAEVQKLVATYSWEAPGLQAIGYQEFKDPETAKQQIITHTRQYAKRQTTWFKRNPDIAWYDSPEQVITAVEAFLTTKDRH